MIYFHDFLGLGDADWKIAPLIKAFVPGRGFGCFGPRVFGDPYSKVKALFNSGKPSMFRLQAIYTKSHKFPSMKYLKEELPRWNELALIYNKPIFISPCCEYLADSKNQVHDYMSFTQEIAPNCGVVQSPGRKSKNSPLEPTFPDWYIEEHGNRARDGCDFFSPDGENAFDMCDQGNANRGFPELMKRLEESGCKYFGVWGARYNLLEAHNTYDSLHRIAPPEPKYVRGCEYLFNKWPAVPAPVFEFTEPKRPRLLKTFAEDHQGPDVRENNPCYMKPKRKEPFKFVDMVTWDNQLVARFSLFKDDNPKRETDRYYFADKYAWQLAERAIKISGSPFVAMKEGGDKFIWPFHAAFRDPFFQVPK